MEFKKFLKWKKAPKPTDILKEYMSEFVELENSPAHRKYRDMIEWRIFNVTQQLLLRKKDEIDYHKGRIDGMRIILQDFKKIKEEAKRRKDGSK